MDRISLASFEHKETGCATPKTAQGKSQSGSQGKSQAGRPGKSRDKSQNTRHHRPAQTGSFGRSARSVLPPPTSLSYNRIECARQAKPLPRRITTDLTPSRPPQGRLRVSAPRSRRAAPAFGASAASSTPPAFGAAPALCCLRALDSRAGGPATPLTLHRTPQSHGPPWGFVMAPRLSALRRSRCRLSALLPRPALPISAQQPSAASTNLPPTLLRRCHA